MAKFLKSVEVVGGYWEYHPDKGGDVFYQYGTSSYNQEWVDAETQPTNEEEILLNGYMRYTTYVSREDYYINELAIGFTNYMNAKNIQSMDLEDVIL